MTQQATDTKAKKNGGSAGAAENWWDQYVNDEHASVDIDLAAFKPELFTARDEKDPEKQVYKGLPLKGFPLAYMKFGNMDETDANGKPIVDENGEIKQKDAMGFAWLLTAPLKTMKNREVHESKPGDRIIVWGNAQMLQGVKTDAANHPTKTVHMVVTPLYKGPHPSEKAQTMWRFKFEEGKVIDRASLPKSVGGVKILELASETQRLAAAALPEAGKDARSGSA